MLKLYHHPLSPNSRRVWIALLEKALPFELVELKLDGDQFQPDFLALNPFHHIPVLVDGNVRVIESLAILDYLEARYPQQALMPTEPEAIATVRMVQMVVLNELSPAVRPLFSQSMGLGDQPPEKLDQAKQQVMTVLGLFETLLGDSPYFGGDHVTLADVVAGVAVPWIPGFGVTLDSFPRIQAWSDRITQRDSWIQTQPSPADWDAFKARMKARMAQPQA